MENKTNLINKLSDAPVGAMLAMLSVIAAVFDILLEILGRRSLTAALGFVAEHPVMFCYNSLIILFTLSLCLFAKKRLLMLLLISAVWLGLGVTNCIVLGYRSSPLSAIDFTIVKSAFGLFTLYLSPVQIALIVLLIAAVIALLALLFVKCPKCRVCYRKSFACVAALGITLFAVNMLATEIDAVECGSGELADAYDSYGFAYCFTRSLVSQGIERPEGYSEDAVEEIIDSLDSDTALPQPDYEHYVDDTTAPEPSETESPARPNIIFVQLESFMDVRRIGWLETSAEVTPNFNSICESGVSGYLKMENIGGGTANSEFEVLTGMDLDHFGFGEYPYTTVLSSRACESIAADLRKQGYGTHALHNHTATFYNRHIVYSNLGFESFTPAELMPELTYNPLGWERDEALTGEIISALDSTEGEDFVFAVTVQGHGKYPDELPNDTEGYPDYKLDYPSEPQISVLGITDEKTLAEYTYYLNELHETDCFIGELIAALEERGEPCVVVFYGDHLPALPLTDGEIDGTLYDADYAVWTNTGLFDGSDGSLDRDLEAYMLSAYILSLCDIDGGDIMKLHAYEIESGKNLNSEQKLLEYSQLYDREPSYEPTSMRFGTRALAVKKFYRSGNTLYIHGSGFTESCVVKIGGFAKATSFISPELLAVENIYFDDGEPSVVWVAPDGTELASAELTPYAE